MLEQTILKKLNQAVNAYKSNPWIKRFNVNWCGMTGVTVVETPTAIVHVGHSGFGQPTISFLHNGLTIHVMIVDYGTEVRLAHNYPDDLADIDKMLDILITKLEDLNTGFPALEELAYRLYIKHRNATPEVKANLISTAGCKDYIRFYDTVKGENNVVIFKGTTIRIVLNEYGCGTAADIRVDVKNPPSDLPPEKITKMVEVLKGCIELFP